MHKKLHLHNVSNHRNFYQNRFINECAKKKQAKILWFPSFPAQSFFVRFRRTHDLNNSVTSLQNINLRLEYFAEGIIEKLYKKFNRV